MAASPLAFLLAFLLSSCAPACRGNVQNPCDLSKCPKNGLTHFYSELKCRPIYQDGTCCPVKYDCSSYSARNNNKCHYGGEEYEIGERIPTNITSRNCLASCSCVGGEDRPIDFVCAQIECAELFGVPLPDPSCIRQYSLNSCCSTSSHCPKNGTESGEEVFQCEFDGKKYIKGQRFYPKDGCKSCICDENYDGTTNGPWCYDISCSIELRSSHYLRQGCAPVFYKKHCCPVQWHCPSDNDQIIEGSTKSPHGNSTLANPDDNIACTFGSLRINLHDTLSTGERSNVKCTCITPPYLSCALVTDN